MTRDEIGLSDEDDFFTLEDLKEEFPQLSSRDWKELARGLNIELRWQLVQSFGSHVNGNGRKRLQGLTAQEIQQIEEAYRPRDLTEDTITVSKLSQRFEMAPKTIKSIARSLGIEPCIYMFRKVHRVEAYTLAQLELIIPLLEKRREMKATKGITPVSKILRQYKLHANTLEKEIQRLGLELKEYQFGSAMGRGLTESDLQLLEPF